MIPSPQVLLSLKISSMIRRRHGITCPRKLALHMDQVDFYMAIQEGYRNG